MKYTSFFISEKKYLTVFKLLSLFAGLIFLFYTMALFPAYSEMNGEKKRDEACSSPKKVSINFSDSESFLPDEATEEKICASPPPLKKGGDYSILVVKSRFKLYLFEKGKLVRVYPVSYGKNPDGKAKERAGDNRTPEGEFTIISIEESSKREWKGRRVYGPWFLRLGPEKWKGFAIHGTDEPDSIGKKASEGCVRLRNEDITELASLVSRGTRVRIIP